MKKFEKFEIISYVVLFFLFISMPIVFNCLSKDEINLDSTNEFVDAGFYLLVKYECTKVWVKRENCGDLYYFTYGACSSEAGRTAVFVPNGVCCDK